MTLSEVIQSSLSYPELYATGCADMIGLLSGQFSEYQSAIVFVRKLDDSIVDAIHNGPTREYFDLYHSVNNELWEVAQKVSARLNDLHIPHLALKPTGEADTAGDDYAKTLRMPFSHKMVATRAGLGWIGKTDLLVTHTFGPRVRLATVLLKEKPFSCGVPIESSRCGACDLCVRKCPACAANGTAWNIQTDRDAFFDAFKCRTYCRQISREKLDEDISLCGLCIFVCPKGKTLPVND